MRIIPRNTRNINIRVPTHITSIINVFLVYFQQGMLHKIKPTFHIINYREAGHFLHLKSSIKLLWGFSNPIVFPATLKEQEKKTNLVLKT